MSVLLDQGEAITVNNLVQFSVNVVNVLDGGDIMYDSAILDLLKVVEQVIERQYQRMYPR